MELRKCQSIQKCVSGGWPTVVWEVVCSQDEKKLAYVLGRYMTCSAGMVRLAIGINIELDPAPQNLKRVRCTFWEIQRFATLEQSGLKLNCLTRCEEYADKELNYVVCCCFQVFHVFLKSRGTTSTRNLSVRRVLFTQ